MLSKVRKKQLLTGLESVILTPEEFREKIKEGMTFYEVGSFYSKPTPPEEYELIKYINERLYLMLYISINIEVEHFIEDHFFCSKCVFLDLTDAQIAFEVLNAEFELDLAWQKSHWIDKQGAAEY